MSEIVSNPDRIAELKSAFGKFCGRLGPLRAEGYHEAAFYSAIASLDTIVEQCLSDVHPMVHSELVSDGLRSLNRLEQGTDGWYRELYRVPLKMMLDAPYLTIVEWYGPDYFKFALSVAMHKDREHTSCVSNPEACPIATSEDQEMCPAHEVLQTSSKILDTALQLRYLALNPYDIEMNHRCDLAVDAWLQGMTDEKIAGLMTEDTAHSFVLKRTKRNHEYIDRLRGQLDESDAL